MNTTCITKWIGNKKNKKLGAHYDGVNLEYGDGNSLRFEPQQHPKLLMEKLNKLRYSEVLTDVILVVEEASFHAHRTVLATCSEFFYAMFTQPMIELSQKTITLNGITAKGFHLILNFIYTSNLLIVPDNVQEILAAAHYLQVEAVVGACDRFLFDQLNVENCIDIIILAERYSLTDLCRKSYRFLGIHMLEMVHAINTDLTWQQLEYLLSTETPVNCSEFELLKIVFDWLKCTVTLDFNQQYRVIKHIHLFDISDDDLDASLKRSIFADPECPMHVAILQLKITQLSVQEKSLSLTVKNPKIKGVLSWNINSTAIMNSSQCDVENIRGLELAMIYIGGFRVTGMTNKISCYLSSTKTWQHLTKIPHIEQCSYGVAVYRNELYIFGGSYNLALNEHVHAYGFCYNPLINEWTSLPPMQTERCRFTLSCVGTNLYAIGGSCESNSDNDSDMPMCEVYNIITKKWSRMPSIPKRCSQHAAVSYKNFVFVSGGLAKQQVLRTFYRFDAIEMEWLELPKLRTPRVDHTMLLVNNKIYICGGWCGYTNRHLLSCIEMYNPDDESGASENSNWTPVTDIPIPSFHSAAIAVDKKIYIIGGFKYEHEIDRSANYIQCFDTETKLWSYLPRYPQNSWECAAVSLYIPKRQHRDWVEEQF